MIKHSISKSQFIKGKQCPKALWLFRHRKDLRPEIDPATQARFDAGHEVGEIAKEYFIGACEEVVAPYWDVKQSVQDTESFIKQGCNVIFEATAMHPVTGAYSRIDALQMNDDGSVDLIEVKSSTGVKEYHHDDMALQYYVFNGAGYDIRNCYMMVLNNQYVREGDIDPKGLFKLEDITSIALEKQEEIQSLVTPLNDVLASAEEPEREIGAHCNSPFECDFKHHCWGDVPEYSIFNLFRADKAFRVGKHIGSYDPLDLPDSQRPNGIKAIDHYCYNAGEVYRDKEKLQDFCKQLEYPVYYLDYETLMPAIPLFDGTRPFQQIPFQFSVHIQHEPNGELGHQEFLHQEATDPRRTFAESLVKHCGDSGSVVVYNKAFEQTRNKELADIFPDLANEINAINERVIDLAEPFRSRHLYHPNQQGSYSIKAVLPAFTKLSYSGMEIANGQQAMDGYLSFVKGNVSVGDSEPLMQNLLEYCKMDTLAMVELFEIIKKQL